MNKIRKTKLKILVLIIYFLFLVSPVFGSLNDYNPVKDARKITLENGLTIITLKNRGPELVSINFFIKTGSIHEDEQNAGISHFCEHMFYRSLEDGQDMKAAIEGIGGVFNAETTKDYTRYYLEIPSQYGLKALDIYSRSLLNIEYSEEFLEKEREVVLEEYNLYVENAMAVVHNKLYEKAFPGHPYSRATIGFEETIKKYSLNSLLNYKEQWYIPRNTVVVLVGNFDEEKYISHIKDIFRTRKNGFISDEPYQPPVTLPLEENFEIIEEKEGIAGQAFFLLGFHSPAMEDTKDVLAVDLLSFLLGQGRNSILYREACKKENLTREISVSYFTTRDPGIILFAAEVEKEKVEDLKKVVLDVIGRVMEGDFSDQQFERARNMLGRSFIYGAQTNNDKAEALGFYEVLYNMDFAKNYINSLEKISREDVTEAAKKYLGKKYVMYVAVPKPLEDDE
ncbi:MAG: M16 family metallopeptidase [Vulcanimicrobiota bacterium]